MVNPVRGQESFPRICRAFLNIFDSYKSSLESRQENPSELVLKILPSEWVASLDGLTLPLPDSFARLAKEMYNRCPAQTGSRSFSSASLTQLAPAIPRTLDFKLTSEVSSIPLDNDSVLHLAYSWSKDSQWLSCCIADDLGTRHWNASFCFAPNESTWSSLRPLVMELWQIATEMLPSSRESCHVLVVRDHAMEDEEIQGQSPGLESSSLTEQCGNRFMRASTRQKPKGKFPWYFSRLILRLRSIQSSMVELNFSRICQPCSRLRICFSMIQHPTHL